MIVNTSTKDEAMISRKEVKIWEIYEIAQGLL